MTPGPQPLEPLTAALLGALQGVAEFLPISSSGHLSLAEFWLGIDPAAGGHTFNIVAHTGTLLAVLVIYRRALWTLVTDGLSPRRDEPDQARTRARDTLVALVVGSVPLGLMLVPGVEDFVVSLEQRPRAVGAALLVTAAVLAASHRAHPPEDDPEQPPRLRDAILIGVAQLCAVIPGISRSGATISAALALGSGRARAARFSFLLSIPAVSAATLKELVDLLRAPADTVSVDLLPLAVGLLTSFVVGLAALGGLLALLRRFGMMVFVPYLLLVGTVAIVWGG